jgi:vacuolar-type H+-ATPase subunit I/STV1
MSPKRQAQYVMELEGRLREKENDAILAADIGQQLLRQVEKLQEQLNQREFNCGENIRPSSNLTTSSPTKSIGLGRSQIASAQAAINDLQKTNAELADRCEHQTSMIQQMQKAANDAEGSFTNHIYVLMS